MADTYSVEEAAQVLQVSNRTVLNLINRGRFPGVYRIDPQSDKSPWRIPKADIENFLELRKAPRVESKTGR